MVIYFYLLTLIVLNNIYLIILLAARVGGLIVLDYKLPWIVSLISQKMCHDGEKKTYKSDTGLNKTHFWGK